MDDLNQSELPTEQIEVTTATTQDLPRALLDAHKNEEAFRAGRSRILEMIAANAPLGEILKRLVLLIEAQSPGMLCSVLLLSDDGNLQKVFVTCCIPGFEFALQFTVRLHMKEPGKVVDL